MNARRLVASLCAAVGLACSCVSAQAAVGHRYLSQLTGTSLSSSVCGVTVDPASHDLFVADPGNNAIDVFDSTGAYESQISGIGVPGGRFSQSACSVAVDDTSGDVYVADWGPGLVYVFNSLGGYVATMSGEGTPAGTFGHGFVTVAVDPTSGDVYIADEEHGVVDRFSAAGHYLSQFTKLAGARTLAVDASGDVFVSTVDRESISEDGLYELDASGKQILHVSGAPEDSFGSEVRLKALAVDAAGHVYGAVGDAINELDATGAYVGHVIGTSSSLFDEVIGVAVDADGDLYVVDSPAKAVDRFGPDILVPEASVEAAAEVGSTSATLHGSVDPDGVQVTSCEFQYGTSAVYGQSVPCQQTPAQIGAGSAPVAVTATPGLEPNTAYHYRLVATNANGSEFSRDETFTTPGPPNVDAESAEVVANKRIGQTSATLQAQITPNGRETTYKFEYGETESYGSSVPAAPGAIGSGGGIVAVPPAELSALKLDTTYHYRVVASNEYGTVDGADQTFTTLPAVLIEGESVSKVTATSATIEAQLNPLGSDTTYRFEYGPSTSYGSSAPVPSGDLGAGESEVTAGLHLQGLLASTVYHFRVVADNASGTVIGADDTFTTQAAGGTAEVADDRAWEMVSPPEKHGADLKPISEQAGEIRAAPTGDVLTYVANLPVEAEPRGFGGKVQELSTRPASGWVSLKITDPHTTVTTQPVGYGPEYRAFSENLSQAAIQPMGLFNPELSAEASEQTAFLRTTYINGNLDEPCLSSCYRPLVTDAPRYANVPAGTVFGGLGGGDKYLANCFAGCGPNFVGATPDMSHVLLRAEAGLTPGAGGSGGLYEWAAGKLAFVGGGTVGNRLAQADRHSISDDGSRIVVDGVAEGLEGLLLRDLASGETVKLDAVQGGSGEGLAEPLFQAASSDGSRVFFIDTQQLTKDAGRGRDLYECELVQEAGKLKCKLSDLTPASSGESAEVQGGVLGVSEDGTWIYLVANGRLGTQAARGTCRESFSPGQAPCNLYALHYNGAEWERPRRIATLSEADTHDWEEHISGQPTRVSPDGKWLAFMAQDSLTGYDNRDDVSGHPDAEVYLYDADADRLRCASCDPTGARPVGREYSTLEPDNGGLVGGPRGIWEPQAWVAANVPGWQHTNISEEVQDYQSRYLSDQGRLFFDSDDALVPQDVDGTEDVYEYEPPGVGVCTTTSVSFGERPAGCVGLISSGTSPRESAFLDASEGGGDVFFITSERLVPQDSDTSLDIYDAHECTVQVPCAAPFVSPPPCATGDACKPAPTPQPSSFGAPASATFSGAGNLTPAQGGVAVPRSLSKAQKLARALKACRRKDRERRAGCERKARRQYAKQKPRKANRKKGKKG